jgi:hypothetical protein
MRHAGGVIRFLLHAALGLAVAWLLAVCWATTKE